MSGETSYRSSFVPPTVASPPDLQLLFLAAMNGQYGGRVDLPRATIAVSDTIEVKNAQGLRILGDSIGGTRIVWTGNDVTKPVFKFDGSVDCRLHNIEFEFEGLCKAAVEITDSGAGTGLLRSTRFHGEDWIVADSDGLLDTVIHVSRTPDGAKNDQHSFRRIQAADYATAFARLEGQASVANRFDDCVAQGRDHGQYGLYCFHSGGAGRGGQFLWTGGVMMQHQVADVYFDGRNGKNLVQGATCEQSARALMVPTAGSAFSGNVTAFRNVDWQNGAGQNPVDNAIFNVAAGGLVVDGCIFGNISAAAAVNDYLFDYNVTASKVLGFSFTNNFVSTPKASAWFPHGAPDSKVGSWQRDPTTGLVSAM